MNDKKQTTNFFINLVKKILMFHKNPAIHNIVGSFLFRPWYYIRDYLNICKSLMMSLITERRTRIIIRKIHGINFQFDLNLDLVIKNMFLGYYEMKLRNLLITYLKRGDIFIDAGANIGFISAIAAGIVGKKGQVHSFEPVPKIYRRLSLLPKLNKNHKIIVNNYALGDKEGEVSIKVSNRGNIGWNTMVPDLMRNDNHSEVFEVNVITLDDYIIENELNEISVIKIDVEGFEFPVLKGLNQFFELNRGNLPILIVELAPFAYSKLGLDLADLEIYLSKYSYRAYDLDLTKELEIKNLKKTTMVLFFPSNSR